MPVRLLLADDHRIFLEGVKSLLESAGYEVVGGAARADEAIRLARELKPDVVVMDVGLPDMSGVAAVRIMLRESPNQRVVLLTQHDEEVYVLEALRAGVAGYVLKRQAHADLVQAIQQVREGGVYLSPGISRAVVEASLGGASVPPDPLTPREREVLCLVAEGKTTKEIAAALGISVKTAEAHRGALMRKLDIHETATLVRYAIRRGLVRA